MTLGDDLMDKKLYCGAARRCITPPAELIPNLYALMKQSFGAVLDDLYVRVLALRNGETTLLFISYDLDKAPCPARWIAAVSERTGVPEENISYSAIHTHTAPLTDERPYDGPNRKCVKSPEQQAAVNHYEELVFAAMTEAVEEAISSLRPAKFGYACTDSYVNVNRNCDYAVKGGGVSCDTGHNGAGDVDRTLFLAKFEAEDGSPIAFFMNYAVHNCVMHMNTIGDGKLAISSDLGGNVSQKLEEQNPGAVALWTSGAAGDVNPILMNAMYYPSMEDGSFTTEVLSGDQTLFLRVLTSRHYADVKRALEQITCDTTELALGSIVTWVKTPGRNLPGEEYDEQGNKKPDPDYCIRLQAIRVGELAICGVSGELYTSFARKIQALSPFERTLIINHNACLMANAQYILDDDGVARDALGYNHSFIRPGYVGPALETATADLFSKLKS